MTQEEKTKRYDEALERAKKLQKTCDSQAVVGWCEYIFPELKESEDEKVRKEILNVFKQLDKGSTICGRNYDYDKWIAWLEKQGKQKTEPKFHPGDWITHNTANFVFKIINVGSNGYEVVNRENYKKTISFDNDDNYHLWTIEDAKDGDVLATSAGAFIYNGKRDGISCPGSYCGINTLGRFQIGGEKHWTGKKVYPTTKEQRDLLFTKMKEAGYKWNSEKKRIEKIEHESVDNVEPKFKPEDYIVPDNINSSKIWKVINIDDDGYYNIQCITNPEYDEIYRVPGFFLEKDYRLWTINDAQDGDVLVCKGKCGQEVGIVKKFVGKYGGYDKCFETYCYSDLDGTFRIGEYIGGTSIHPATKEQRELLFQNMKETGWEWDNDKKELKKI